MIFKAVMLSFRFGIVTSLIVGEQRVIKGAGAMDYAEISIIYVYLNRTDRKSVVFR